ncbi:MAG: Gfo/Idh/MocA family protein [Christensenellales bacterium]|jgi:predicted dehydrogenase
MDKHTIGIGMVGGGFMAKAHNNAYKTIPYIYHQHGYTPLCVAIASSSLERAHEAARRYGYEKAVSGYEQIVTDPAVQVVDICAPDAMHRDIAVAALENGKHVLCEKPLATNLQDAYSMVLAARAHPELKAMTGFNYRFLPAVALAKRLLEDGTMGRAYSFNGTYLQDVGAFDDTPYENLWYVSGPKNSGAAYGIGCHLIDMARYLMGDIAAVMAESNNYHPVRPLKDGGARKVEQDEETLAVVRFENGAGGTLRSSAVEAGRKNEMYWSISCDKGSIWFNLQDPNYLHVFHKDCAVRPVTGFTKINVTQWDREHPFMDVWWPRGHSLGWEHAHINEIACFLRCVDEDLNIAPQGATFEDGFRAVAVIEACKRSSAMGKRIALEEIYRSVSG